MSTTKTRRPRGRPPSRSETETQDLVLRAAYAEFVEVGLDQASMGRIAERAGISTRTLYKCAAGKEALFCCAVAHRIDAFFAETPFTPTEDLTPQDELARILDMHVALLLSPDVLATTRMVITGLERFPDLAEQLHSVGRRVALSFAAQIRVFCLRRGLSVEGIEARADLLRWTLSGIQRQELLAADDPMSEADRKAATHRLAALFLAGAGPA